MNTRSYAVKVLMVLIVVSLFPGLIASAAPRGAFQPSNDCETSNIGPNSVTIPVVDCCEAFVQPDVNGTTPVSFRNVDDCCELAFEGGSNTNTEVGFRNVDDCCDEPSQFSGAVQGAAMVGFETVQDDCCDEPGAFGANAHNTTLAAFVTDDPCATPAPVNQTCGITLPTGSVVGDMPTNEQAYWAPGKISPNVIINAGTYWVTGEEKADNGDEYYRILVACQYLWVPVGTMQPSYQAPWTGQPLPTFSAT